MQQQLLKWKGVFTICNSTFHLSGTINSGYSSWQTVFQPQNYLL